MNSHRRDKPDVDTETGLPSKLGWKFMRWVVPVMYAVAVWYLARINSRLDKLADDYTAINTRLSRIEGKLNMVAQTPVIAVDAEAR